MSLFALFAPVHYVTQTLPMHYSSWMSHTGEAIDAVGVVIIVLGSLFGLLVTAPRAYFNPATRASAYSATRRMIGRSILLGLELLVAGDIIRTVATTPTFTSVGVLAIIVAIRSFLSWSLELEITGRWPWQHAKGSAD